MISQCYYFKIGIVRKFVFSTQKSRAVIREATLRNRDDNEHCGSKITEMYLFSQNVFQQFFGLMES